VSEPGYFDPISFPVLRKDVLPFVEAHFRAVGLTLCPGNRGRAWGRDIDIDPDPVREWGAEVVFSLVERHEIEFLEVQGLSNAVERRADTDAIDCVAVLCPQCSNACYFDRADDRDRASEA
jgi:hypothetical protein